jgi:hypothetical protein
MSQTLPNARKPITLRDAALYITKLPKAAHDREEWQAAMEALLLFAESGGPTMFARIGVRRALNHSKPAPKDHATPQACKGLNNRPMKAHRGDCAWLNPDASEPARPR